MHSIQRTLDLSGLMGKSSHFLFGARGTGKSWLIRNTLLEKVCHIDLLHSETFLKLQANPSRLEGMIDKNWVAIDEIQRLPQLLNEIHRLIESKRLVFLLTGSSARKLRRGGVNLLAGRAFLSTLFPLTWRELEAEKRFDLDRYLQTGGLPQSVLGNHPREYLKSYVETYLKEEIQQEALVRNLASYHRFLNAAACGNGEMANFSKIANDAGLRPNTVRDHYKILQDTLLGEMLPSWKKSKKRKAIQTPKFYFFDIGVAHTLKNVTRLDPESDLYGKAFEHFLYMELKACLSYSGGGELSYWRSKSGYEVDFIIDDNIAVEVKSKKKIGNRDIKGLAAISEEAAWKHKLLVSRDPESEKFGKGIEKLHWREFLQNLWSGAYF